MKPNMQLRPSFQLLFFSLLKGIFCNAKKENSPRRLFFILHKYVKSKNACEQETTALLKIKSITLYAYNKSS